jgi:hypothetical protein
VSISGEGDVVVSESEEVTGSETTSTGSFSVFSEINELVEKCHTLHSHIHNSGETLQNIQSLVLKSKNITISYDDVITDFDEVLEELHEDAMRKIEETGESDFCKNLLDILERAVLS